MKAFDRFGYCNLTTLRSRQKTDLEKAQDNIEKLLQIVEGLEARIEELEEKYESITPNRRKRNTKQGNTGVA